MEKDENVIPEMSGYKAFDENLQCRGFRYSIGGEYKTDRAELCDSGFHFCEDPLATLNYYNRRFAKIEARQVQDKTEDDTKRAAREIKITAELSLSAIIEAGLKFRFSKATNKKASATGNNGASSATGNNGASSATGNNGASSATGYKGASSATGNNGASSATGDYGASSATGNNGASSATGNNGASSATGDNGASSATGYKGASSATGYKGASSATGNNGASSATGDYGASSAGAGAVALSIGYSGAARGDVGAWLVLAECEQVNGETFIQDVKSVKVDGDTIKPGVFYALKNGQFIEVE